MPRITCGVISFGFWMLITWSLDPQMVLAGAFFSALAGWAYGELLPKTATHVFDPRRWFWLLVYLPYFLSYVVRANLDVAYRVVHPDMPIRPGIVRVKTTLKSPLAKTFLATSITLTPGTMAVDIIEQDLYIHWIYVSTEDPAEQTREIVRPFEPLLRKIFE